MYHGEKQKPMPFFESPENKTRYPNKSVREVNPNNEPYGAYTGRCSRCQSDNLWDDQSAYDCNNCGAVFRN